MPGVLREGNGGGAREVHGFPPARTPPIATIVSAGKRRVGEGAIRRNVAVHRSTEWPDELLEATPSGRGDDSAVSAVSAVSASSIARHWQAREPQLVPRFAV